MFDHQLSLKSYAESGIIENLTQANSIDVICINLKSSLSFLPSIRLSRHQKFLLGVNANLYWLKISKKSDLARIMVSREFRQGRVSFSAIEGAAGKSKAILVARVLKFCRISAISYIPKAISQDSRILAAKKIVYVSVGGSTSLHDSLRALADKRQIPFGIIFENWDNIFSKAVFNKKPKQVGVWGSQALIKSKELHDLSDDQMYFVGSPRIDYLLEKYAEIAITDISKRDDIFFAGGSINLAEELCLVEGLGAYLRESQLDFSLSYLPHPKYYREVFLERGRIQSQGIRLLPEQVIDSGEFHPAPPNLNEYPEIYAKARMTISSFSTMNLESYLLGIPSIAIDLKYPNVGPRVTLTRQIMPHLSDPKVSSIFHVVESLGELIDKVVEISTSEPQNREMSDSEKSFYYYRESTFAERFERFVNELVKGGM